MYIQGRGKKIRECRGGRAVVVGESGGKLMELGDQSYRIRSEIKCEREM